MAVQQTLAQPAEAKPKTNDKRAELAEAAYRIIAAKGLDGLSIRLLARAVGARSSGIVSHYFIDRAEIIAAALEHAATVMRRRPDTRLHPVEMFVSVLPIDDEAIESWRFTLAVRAGALTDPSLVKFDNAINDYWHQYMPDLLKAHGVIGVDVDAHDAVDFIVAVVDGIALRATLAPQDWPASRQRAHIEGAFHQIGEAGSFQSPSVHNT